MTSRFPAARGTLVHSGQAWLGSIPRHWPTKRIKFQFSCVGGGTPSKDEASYWAGTIPWASPKDFAGSDLFDTEDHITEEAVRTSATKVVAPGSLLMVVRSGVLRHTIPVAINRVATALNQDLKALAPRAPLLPEYLKYLIVGKNDQLLSHWSQLGCTVESLDTVRVLNTAVPIPPQEEQIAIVKFLDRETACIDALIEKKRRLIELLQEKRVAVITHAVTQGLRAGVPATHSTIKWLGDIPLHWGVTRLKHATSRIVDCPHETPTYSTDGEYVVVRTADTSPGLLMLDAAYRVEVGEYLRRIRRESLKAGDIVYGREGERWGNAASVPAQPTMCLGQRMMQFRASKEWHPRFLMWQLNALNVYRQGAVDTTGATSPHVNVETIRNYWLAEPPLEEQRLVADFLDKITSQIDRLISRVEAAIERIGEYRSSLVSAAVTGQIDVREAA